MHRRGDFHIKKDAQIACRCVRADGTEPIPKEKPGSDGTVFRQNRTGRPLVLLIRRASVGSISLFSAFFRRGCINERILTILISVMRRGHIFLFHKNFREMICIGKPARIGNFGDRQIRRAQIIRCGLEANAKQIILRRAAVRFFKRPEQARTADVDMIRNLLHGNPV